MIDICSDMNKVVILKEARFFKKQCVLMNSGKGKLICSDRSHCLEGSEKGQEEEFHRDTHLSGHR